jgi:valyl-tRNA synthetase
MSKSRNNGVDPIEMFDKFGVDATRIYLASIATGADIKWNDVGVETYRNFANKIWNATRFCLLNSENATVDHSSLMSGELSLADKWIISRLNRTALEVNRALGRYEFHSAVSLLYHFFWDDFCDWYIELVKDEITSGDAVGTTKILTILEIALRMLHPFMPYLTEELWFKLPGTGVQLFNKAYGAADATIMLTTFPPGDVTAVDERSEDEMQFVIELIKKVRNIRSEMNIKPSDRVPVYAAVSTEQRDILTSNETQILKLARVSNLALSAVLDVPKASARAVITGGAEIAIPLEGLIDFDKERSRLNNQITKLETELVRISGQLSNANFVERAPAEKVDELRGRSAELEDQIATLRRNVESLE